MTQATIIVEHRHLDTDERRRRIYTVDAPIDDSQERTRLLRLVGDLHPEAAHRSYADGAATFLSPHHLIVAFYEPRAMPGRNARGGSATPQRAEQDRLFH